MTDLMVFAGVVVLLTVIGVIGVIRARIERHGFLVLSWRFLTGMPHHGKAITDAGWLRPGTKALTRTGHASRFHHRPRLHRTGMRGGSILALLLLAWGAAQDAVLTAWALIAAAAVAAGYAMVQAVRRWQSRKHRRAWLEPLHASVAPIVGIPVENNPASWLTVARDRKKATLTLPPGWHGTRAERDLLLTTVTAKLGMVRPEPKWLLEGPSHQLVVEEAVPPPPRAGLSDVRQAIERAKPRELVVGPGKAGSVVSVSLDSDSPHIGASMGSGAGKSTLGRFLLAQHLRNGGIGLILDAKLFSHPWAWGLPNVAYADSPQLMHEALCWLGAELNRRNQVGKLSTDTDGVMHGNPGASLMVLAEELNLTMPMLRDFWRDEMGGRGKSPAIQALENVQYAGRQVFMFLLMIGQMLTAPASGSGAGRENVGIRILARYTLNNWKMLAPEHAMPLASGVDGRVQVVASGKVREAQVPFLSPGECRRLALSGIVTPLPAGMPGRTATPSVGPAAAGEITMAPSRPVTLSESVRLGIVPMSLSAIRTARHREPDSFPRPVGLRGAAHVYQARELAGWYLRRNS